jgi:hypothetical protein
MTDPRAKGEGWIGVDLDGTLAHYDGVHRGEDFIGKPVEPMVRKVRKWMIEGKDVRLFTARSPHPAIRKWMRQHLGAILPITNTKDRHMIALYDDRVVQVARNEGKTHPDHEEQIWGDQDA